MSPLTTIVLVEFVCIGFMLTSLVAEPVPGRHQPDSIAREVAFSQHPLRVVDPHPATSCSQHSHQSLLALSFSALNAAFNATTLPVSFSSVAPTTCSSLIVSMAASSSSLRLRIADLCLMTSLHRRSSSDVFCGAL